MDGTTSAVSVGLIIGLLVAMLALMVFFVFCMWRIFTKAGQPGWAAIVPIYNTYVLLKLVGRPGWWLLLMLIPGVNIVIAIIVMIDLAGAFGKGSGFAVLLILLPMIAYPILALGSSTYRGPIAAQGPGGTPPEPGYPAQQQYQQQYSPQQYQQHSSQRQDPLQQGYPQQQYSQQYPPQQYPPRQ